MFREVARKKQALDAEKSIELLKTARRGVLAVLGDDGYPYAVPLNHFYCPEDGKLYYHSGMTGHKLDAIARCPKVSYNVISEGRRLDGNWYLEFDSVTVFGKVEIITDREKLYDIARRLSRKFTDDEAYIQREIQQSGPATLMFALMPEQITGKLVREK